MDVTWSASEGLSPNFRSVGDHIYYYFVPDWPGMDATRSVSEGLEPNFRFVLLEKPGIGGGDRGEVSYCATLREMPPSNGISKCIVMS